MKAASVLICVFVKKAKLDLPSNLVLPIQQFATSVEPILLGQSRETGTSKAAGSDIGSDPCGASEDLRFLVDLVCVVLASVLMFVAFTFMEGDLGKNSKKQVIFQRFSFNAKSKVVPQADLPKTSQAVKKSSPTFGFKKGFLSKKRPSESSISPKPSAQKKQALCGLAASVDTSKAAKVVDRGNVSTVYELFNSKGEEIGIFKPYEKIKGSSDSSVLSSRKQCMNEVVAYHFDQAIPASQQAGVPETQMVRLPGRMFGENNSTSVAGSVQKFLPETESCEDYGPGIFSKDDIHKIGILDIRVLNCDRHTGNILVNKQSKKLYPIDHALSFPEVDFDVDLTRPQAFDKSTETLYLADASFDWLLFPQTKAPLSEEMLSAISSIDIKKDMAVQKSMGMSIGQRLATYMSTSLLKHGALKQNLSLYEIGRLIQRKGARNEASVLEDLSKQALSLVDKNKVLSEDAGELETFFSVFEKCMTSYFKL